MFPVGLLPLLVGVAWACPDGLILESGVCISRIKSTSWEEGRAECAHRGGPSAVLVPSNFPSGKVPPEILLPQWALPKELDMEADSEDECHVRPGCVLMQLSCHGTVWEKTSNRTTCYQRVSNAKDEGPCSVRIHQHCKPNWGPHEEHDCFKYKNEVFRPTLSIDYRNGELHLLNSERYLLDDCWCIMAELDSIYENKTIKAAVISDLSEETDIVINFTKYKGDLKKGAVWCQCFEKWTGLMLKTKLYSTGFCPNDGSHCKETSVIPEDKRVWCDHLPECSKTTSTTSTAPPEDLQLDVIEKLDMAVKDDSSAAINNVTVTLQEFQEALKSVMLKKGSNVSFEGEAISALVLPNAIGIKVNNSGLSNVTEGVTAKDLAQNMNVTAAVVLRKPQRVAFVVYKDHDVFQDDNFHINSPVVEVFAEDPYVDVVLRPEKRVSDRRCAFWDLQIRRWNTSGCNLTVKDQVNDVCHCDHLTTFAQIVMNTEVLTAVDEEVLEYVSVVGCGASLLGALGTVVAAALCREWSGRKSTLMLLHLTAAVALRDVLFLAAAHGAAARWSRSACVGVGVALHYAELAAGAWCVIAGALQVYRFTTLTRGSVDVTHLVLRCVLVAWPTAALPVVTLLCVQGLQAYVPGGRFAPGLCFPRGSQLLWAVTLPLGGATLINAGVFLFLVWTLCGFSADAHLKAAKHGGPGLRTKALKCVMLFFLLGLPWVFGVPAGSRFLAYVFCLTATPQGLVLFLFFVLSNKDLRSAFSLTFRRNVLGYLERLNSSTDTSIILKE